MRSSTTVEPDLATLEIGRPLWLRVRGHRIGCGEGFRPGGGPRRQDAGRGTYDAGFGSTSRPDSSTGRYPAPPEGGTDPRQTEVALPTQTLLRRSCRRADLLLPIDDTVAAAAGCAAPGCGRWSHRRDRLRRRECAVGRDSHRHALPTP